MPSKIYQCAFCHREFIAKNNYNRKYCSRTCKRESTVKYSYSDPVKKAWYRCRRDGRKNVRAYCSIEELNNFWETSHICSYCNISEEEWQKKYKRRLEMDRKDPTKGYIIENLVWACHRCNTIKNNFLSYLEMKEIGERYIKPKWKNNLL